MSRSPALRDDANAILGAGVAAADPTAAVRRAVAVEADWLVVDGGRTVHLAGLADVWIVGAGKATHAMAVAVADLLGDRMSGGAITVPRGLGSPIDPIDVWEAGHPIPDSHGLAAAAETLRVARRAGADDLVICLLSGGASALWPAPVEGVSLSDLQLVTRQLLRAGAPILEINTVRKHLSRIAGGQLARAAAPARVLTLVVSDVIAAPLDVIGSGPSLPDPTTFQDALAILHGRGVTPPPSVTHYLQRGVAKEVPETVKADELTNDAGFFPIASIAHALEAAAEEARLRGYATHIVSDRVEGEARDVGREIASAAMEAQGRAPKQSALLWGGETTVTVAGEGIGGRNQELTLAAARRIEGVDGIVVASMGTDGIDGPSPAAGAVVDGGSVRRGQAAGLDFEDSLARNDSYRFLEASGDLIVTGPTGTNVNDLILALIEPTSTGGVPNGDRLGYPL